MQNTGITTTSLACLCALFGATPGLTLNPHVYGRAGDDGAQDVVAVGTGFYVVGRGSDPTATVSGMAVTRHDDIDVVRPAYGSAGMALSFADWSIAGTAYGGVDDGAGGIVVVGVHESEYGSWGASIVRFDAAGVRLWERPVGGSLFDVARDSAGRFVAVGTSGDWDGSQLQVVRVDAAGNLDTTFNATGTRLLSAGCASPATDGGSAVLVQPDGKIVVGGVATCGGNTDLFVARLLPGGGSDGAFGVSGRSLINLGSNESVAALALRSDGKIVVAGNQTGAAPYAQVLALLQTNGALDTSFGIGGTRAWSLGAEDARANDLVVLPDNRILLVGRIAARGTGTGDLLLTRYASSGVSRDTTFNGDGTLRYHHGRWPDALTEATGVLRKTDGSYVVVGVHKARTATGTAGDLLVLAVSEGGTIVGDPSKPGSFPVGSTTYDEGVVTFTNPGDLAYPTYDVPLIADVRYPAAYAGVSAPLSSARARYPLVIVGGGHYPAWGTYPGFDYLLDQLASQGFIAVSVNLDMFHFSHNPEADRGRGLLHHLNVWRARNAGTGLFGGRVDLAKVAIAGHSQGGGGVLEAVRLNASEGWGHTITTAIAIAPTDGSGSTSAPTVLPAATSYLALYGSNDRDVGRQAGFPFGSSGTAFRAFDRALGEKATLFAIDGCHNLFNSYLNADAGPDAIVLSRAEHENLLKGAVTAWLQLQLDGRAEQRDFFVGARRLPSVSTVDVRTEHRQSSRRVIEDFDDVWPGWNNFYGTSIASSLSSSLEGPLNTLERASPQTSRGLKVRWAGYTGSWRTTLPAGNRSFAGWGALSLRAGVTWGVMGDVSDGYTGPVGLPVTISSELNAGVLSSGARAAFNATDAALGLTASATVVVVTPGVAWRIEDGTERTYTVRRSARTSSGGGVYYMLEVWRLGAASNSPVYPQDFRVRLRDVAGHSVAVAVTPWGRLAVPDMPYSGPGAVENWSDTERTLAPLSTVRIPLSAWSSAGIDLTNVTDITFEFSSVGSGELLLDDLELVP